MKTDIARNLLLIITVLLIELSSEDNEEDETEKDSLEDDVEPFHTNNKLGLLNGKGKLRKRFAKVTAFIDANKNVVCSPEAALFHLEHLALGARGLCLEQLLQAVGLASKTQIPKAFGYLVERLKDIHGVTLTVVSKIFISDEIKLKKKFVDRTQTIFQSTVSKVNFTSPSKVVNSINKYISSKTRGRITQLLQPDDLQQSSSMVLITVVCFAGDWKYRFTHAKIADFDTPKGPEPTVMLTREGFYQYYESKMLEAKFIEIPYKGDQASLLIILPNSDMPLEGLLEMMNTISDEMQKAIESMAPKDMILSIPRFSVETHLDMKYSFTKIGVKEIFNTDNSGLDAIAESKKQKVHVSLAIQRAIIEVDDYGWEKHLEQGGYQEQDPTDMDRTFTVDVNRPFVFYVKFLNEQLMAGIFAQTHS